jgi:hypothetical protein
MAIMMAKLYAALKEGGVSEDAAVKAAEEVASYENRLAKIEADLLLLKWMVGATFAGVVTLLFKAFQ